MRLFTAVEIGETMQARAATLLAELRRRAESSAPRAKVTWVAAARLHLTLRFIGEVDAGTGERIVHALRDEIPMAPFTVEWGGLGAFPPRGAPRVLWVGVAAGAEALVAAEKHVSDRLAALGIAREARPYSPHLTLARVREPAGLKAATLFERVDASLGETAVDAITLFQSHLSPKGPTYTALSKSRLKGPTSNSNCQPPTPKE
jgi:RNA 2',3'-cyclic 3'-phosphodiesterase